MHSVDGTALLARANEARAGYVAAGGRALAAVAQGDAAQARKLAFGETYKALHAFAASLRELNDYQQRRRWDTKAGLGREKIFEVRRIHNDLTFIDEFLTLDFVRDHKLFRFGYNPASEAYEIESREFPKVKQQLLQSLTNRGRPIITVVDGNYKNRGELFLVHRHEGLDLKQDWARDTLRHLQAIWSRPVHLRTLVETKPRIISFDGTDFSEKDAPAGAPPISTSVPSIPTVCAIVSMTAMTPVQSSA